MVIRDGSKGDEWDELARYLRAVVADEVTKAFISLEEGRLDVRTQIVDLLQEEDIAVDGRSFSVGDVAVGDLWQGKSIDPEISGGKKAWSTGLTGLRGAQGGILMFGMMGTFLPPCLLYTSGAADERSSGDLGGRRILSKKQKK